MITKRICFILGAGASMEFGFPSGLQLRNKICEIVGVEENSHVHGWRSHFQQQYKAKANSFVKELEESGTYSIDAFLERRSGYLDIGKDAIAAALIPHERRDAIFNSKSKGNTWYDYLFNQMTAPIEEFGDNQISFLTYNYDRSLEFYFETALRNRYAATTAQVRDIFKKIPIIHLHGKLGNMPIQDDDGLDNSRPFTPDIDDNAVCIASQSIRIIHEDIARESQFSQAVNALSNADYAVFLGFGYDETNLNRLNLKAFPDLKYSGTCYGMTKTERDSLVNSFDGRLDVWDIEILPFLRETGIIAKERQKVFPQSAYRGGATVIR